MSDTIILHLSDLHFGGDWNPQRKAERQIVLGRLIELVAAQEAAWKPTCICISGDIAYRGKREDYDAAEEWLKKLLETLDLSFADVIPCPGNHDVCRPVAERNARPNAATEADKILELPVPSHLEKPFAEYSAFCKRVGIPTAKIADNESHLVGEIVHHGVCFVVVNSSWFSKDDDDDRKLWIGLPLLRVMEAHNQLPLCDRSVNQQRTVALLHHPRESLHPDEIHAYSQRPNSFDYLAKRCHLLLSGHTHGELRSADRIAESAWHITAGATYEDASYFNSFRIIRLEGDRLVYRSFAFDPRSSDAGWREFDSAQELPFSVTTTDFPKSETDLQKLDLTSLRAAVRRDAARTIEVKSRQIRLSGELPEILELRVSSRVSKQLIEYDQQGQLVTQKDSESSVPLREVCQHSRRTFLLGDLGSGKSTLALQFVVECLDRNDQGVAYFIPVKELRLPQRFRIDELLQAIDEYIRGQVCPTGTDCELRRMLDSRTEIAIAFDGLDELSQSMASWFVRQAAALADHWPNIQILATGRPIELAGVSYDLWETCRTEPSVST